MNAVSQPMPTMPTASRRLPLRLSQLLAVFALSLRIARRSKRLWILALVACLPMLLPLIHIVLVRLSAYVPPFPEPMGFFKNLVGTVYLHVILYVLALAYGLSVISDEVEGKTLVHLMLRPIPRWAVVLGKFLATWLLAGLLLVVSLILTYVLAWLAQKDPAVWKNMFNGANLRTLLFDALVFFYALGAYLALFTWIGAWLPHGERWGVVFCFGWESLITYLPANIKYFTLMFHIQTLFPHPVSVAKLIGMWAQPLSKTACFLILLAVIAVSLSLTVRILQRKEIR